MRFHAKMDGGKPEDLPIGVLKLMASGLVAEIDAVLGLHLKSRGFRHRKQFTNLGLKLFCRSWKR